MTANFIARLRPELLTTGQSETALVLESVSFVLQPVALFDPLDFSTDGRARLMLFAKNLEQVTQPSQLSMTAEDAEHRVYPLPVEYVGIIPGQSWVKQINVRVWPGLGDGKCVKLRLFADGLQSNITGVCFAPANLDSNSSLMNEGVRDNV